MPFQGCEQLYFPEIDTIASIPHALLQGDFAIKCGLPQQVPSPNSPPPQIWAGYAPALTSRKWWKWHDADFGVSLSVAWLLPLSTTEIPEHHVKSLTILLVVLRQTGEGEGHCELPFPRHSEHEESCAADPSVISWIPQSDFSPCHMKPEKLASQPLPELLSHKILR